MTANEYYFEQVSELLEDRLEKEGTICLADVKEDLSKIPQHGKHSKKSEFISYDQMARAFTAIMKCMLEMKRAKKGHQHGHYIITKTKTSTQIVTTEPWIVRKVEDVAVNVKISNGIEITMCGEFVDNNLTVNSVEPSFVDSATFEQLNEQLKCQIKLMVAREFKQSKQN